MSKLRQEIRRMSANLSEFGDGVHYEGCHCNDVCACSDPIECIHEECICDRLRAAYQRGCADEWESARQPQVIITVKRPLTKKQIERIRAAIRGEDAE